MGTNKQIMRVVICCDADPDRERFGAPPLEGSHTFCWNGIERGLPALLDSFSTLKDDHGGEPRLTWLIRADEQVRELEGAFDGAFLRHRAFWEECQSRGDELAWHPHYWRMTQGLWQQERQDAEWMLEMLKTSYGALNQHYEVDTVKTGWCYMDDATMETFRALGLQNDVSAMPFQRYEPRPQDGQAYFGAYNWSRAGYEPYRPAPGDYQQSDMAKLRDDHGNGSLWEMPVTVGDSSLVTMLENAVLSLRRRQWPKRRAAQRNISLKLSFHPFLFGRLWGNAWKRLREGEEPLVHFYFHPDECLPEGRSALRPYHLGHFKRNLNRVLADARHLGFEVKFMTVQGYRREVLDRVHS